MLFVKIVDEMDQKMVIRITFVTYVRDQVKQHQIKVSFRFHSHVKHVGVKEMSSTNNVNVVGQMDLLSKMKQLRSKFPQVLIMVLS